MYVISKRMKHSKRSIYAATCNSELSFTTKKSLALQFPERSKAIGYLARCHGLLEVGFRVASLDVENSSQK